MGSPLTAIGPPGPIDPFGGLTDRPEPAAPRPTATSSAAPPAPPAPPDDAETAPKAAVFEAPPSLPDYPRRELSVRHEPDLNQVVVQVLDSKTKEVVRQIPPEEVLSVLKQLQKTGVLLDKRG
jgi:flagellar protein FlaG